MKDVKICMNCGKQLRRVTVLPDFKREWGHVKGSSVFCSFFRVNRAEPVPDGCVGIFNERAK